MEMNWVEIIVSILSGLAVCIPVVVQLVKAMKSAADEKNWPKIVEVVLDLMTEAERQFKEGIARKAWVMAGVETAAKSINYNYDDAARQKVSDMIDAICATAKIVNNRVGEKEVA